MEEKSKYIKICYSFRCNGKSTHGKVKSVGDFVCICPDCKSVLVTKKASDVNKRMICAERKVGSRS